MKVIAFACLLATVTAADAYAVATPYLAITGDVITSSNSTISGAQSGSVNYDTSKGGEVAVGFEPSGFVSSLGDVRLELEGGYHPLSLGGVDVNGAANATARGNLNIDSAMANAYFDLSSGGIPLVPYVGAGIGDAYVRFAKNNGFGATTDTNNQFAYQLMLGLGYTMPSMPRIDFFLGYRYLTVDGPEFNTSSGDIKFNTMHVSNVDLGLRYHF